MSQSEYLKLGPAERRSVLKILRAVLQFSEQSPNTVRGLNITPRDLELIAAVASRNPQPDETPEHVTIHSSRINA